MKYIVQIFCAISLIGLGYYLVPNELRANLVAQGIIALVTLLTVQVAMDIYQNFGRFKLVVQCAWHSLFHRYVRFSMSYQYRIKVKDRYLLVKNSNWDHYQHVGGKYKRLPVTQKVLADYGAVDDLKLPTSGLMKADLAVFVPARNAIKFLDWFDSGREREISHWREFFEELIEGKGSVLTKVNFPYVTYDFVCSIRTPLKKALGWECLEILQYDVLDLLPTQAQQEELEQLLDAGDTDYIKWADHELIQSLGHDRRSRTLLYRIGRHTKWVLNLAWCAD